MKDKLLCLQVQVKVKTVTNFGSDVKRSRV
jgi:hypothetical protein